MKNYYFILGIHRYSTQEEIEKAYEELSKRYHPKNTNWSELYKERYEEVKEAYNVLSKPKHRAWYDQQYYPTLSNQLTAEPYQPDKTAREETTTTPKVKLEKTITTAAALSFLFALTHFTLHTRSCNSSPEFEYKSSGTVIISDTISQQQANSYLNSLNVKSISAEPEMITDTISSDLLKNVEK